MGYLCLSCFNEYDKEMLNLNSYEGYNYKCPNVRCGDMNLVEIDDLILPIIKLLNIKGYITSFCCSSHSYESDSHCANTYIAFEDDYFPKIIPKGFKVEVNTPMCIRKYYKEGLNDYQLHKEICKTMIELMKWAEKLPEWEESYDEEIE